MKEENQAIIKALNMYGRVPEQWELLNEIERLNNIINELEDSIVGKINVLYQVKGQSRPIQELYLVLDKLRELKGDSNE